MRRRIGGVLALFASVLLATPFWATAFAQQPALERIDLERPPGEVLKLWIPAEIAEVLLRESASGFVWSVDIETLASTVYRTGKSYPWATYPRRGASIAVAAIAPGREGVSAPRQMELIRRYQEVFLRDGAFVCYRRADDTSGSGVRLCAIEAQNEREFAVGHCDFFEVPFPGCSFYFRVDEKLLVSLRFARDDGPLFGRQFQRLVDTFREFLRER